MSTTYYKYYPNVYIAKCDDAHEKGEVIKIETQYGKINEHIIHNLIAEKDGYFYYSITRLDGFKSQERARKMAEKLQNASSRAKARSDKAYEASQEGKEFLALAEPIKIGHHSEKRHRGLIERNHKRMQRSFEEQAKSQDYANRSQYYENQADKIDLSMPESLEYFSRLLEKAKERHQGLKNGTVERSHSFSLTYAKKEVNELEKKVKIAEKLWK